MSHSVLEAGPLQPRQTEVIPPKGQTLQRVYRAGGGSVRGSSPEDRAHPSPAPGLRSALPREPAAEPAVGAQGRRLSAPGAALRALRLPFVRGLAPRRGRESGGRRAARNPGFAGAARLMENRCLSPGPEHGMEVTDPRACWKRGRRVQALGDPAGRRRSLGSPVFAASA